MRDFMEVFPLFLFYTILLQFICFMIVHANYKAYHFFGIASFMLTYLIFMWLFVVFLMILLISVP